MVAAGGTLGATWTGIVGPTPKDWVGVYVPGAPDGTTPPPVWRYTDGSATDDVAIPVPAGFAPGSYELRLFANDGYTRLATSNCFVVGLPNNACFLPEPPPSGSEHNAPLINGDTAGSGVHTLTGNYSTSETDVALDGRGPTPKLTRTYNSNDTRVGPLGPGWTHNYALRLVRSAGSPNVVLVGGQGRSDTYTLQPDGTYTARPGVYLTLAKQANGSHTATTKDLGVWTFDVQGRLVSILDRHGNQSTLSYNAQGQLVAVSDPAQRGSLAFEYDTDGRLLRVKDWQAPQRVVQYGYDPGQRRLQTVTDRTAAVTTYGYHPTIPRLLTTITNANSHLVLTNTYNATTGRVESQRDGANHLTNFDYGSLVTTVTMPAPSYEPSFQPTLVDAYNPQGFLAQRLTRPSSAENVTIAREYNDPNHPGLVTDQIDGRGSRTRLCYDVDYTGATIAGKRGSLTRKIQPQPGPDRAPPVTLYEYDSQNNPTREDPPLGVLTNFNETVTCSTSFAGRRDDTYATITIYDNPVQPQWRRVQRQYHEPNAAGIPVVGPQTALTTTEYNAAGQVTREIPPRGYGQPEPNAYATVHTYYASGPQAGLRQTSQAPGTSGAVTFTYDAVGRLTQKQDATGQLWNSEYDAEDRLTRALAPAPVAGQPRPTTTAAYDAVGNRITAVDARGQITRYRYDERELLKEVRLSPTLLRDPNVDFVEAARAQYGYDALGQREWVRLITGLSGTPDLDPAERATQYLHDGAGRLRREIQYPQWPNADAANRLITTYSYDPNGNRTSLQKPVGYPGGVPIQSTYDALNRLTQIQYSDGVTGDPVHQRETFDYDRQGRRTQMIDATGTTLYTYDQRGQLTRVSDGANAVVRYHYDRDGQRTKLIYPDAADPNGKAVTYLLDPGGRLTRLDDWAGRWVQYDYRATDGQLVDTTRWNFTKQHREYDLAGRLKDLHNHFSSGTETITRDEYQERDPLGNPRQVRVSTPSGYHPTVDTQYFNYDGLNRLTDYTDSTFPLRDYGYDTASNRTSLVTPAGGNTQYQYDRADRIDFGPLGDYTVDANGRTTLRQDGPGLSQTQNYDQADRLRDAVGIYGTATYTYDGDGRRAKKHLAPASGTATDTPYVDDLAQKLPVLLQDGDRRYMYGLGAAYSVKLTGSPDVQVLHTDARGSVRAATSESNVILQVTRYDPFGNTATTINPGLAPAPLGFAGEHRDPETGLVYLRARWYDPKIGRFLSRDTVVLDVRARGSSYATWGAAGR